MTMTFTKWAILIGLAGTVVYVAIMRTAIPARASTPALSNPKQRFEQGKVDGHASGVTDGKAGISSRVTSTRAQIEAILKDPTKWMSDSDQAYSIGYSSGYLDGYEATAKTDTKTDAKTDTKTDAKTEMGSETDPTADPDSETKTETPDKTPDEVPVASYSEPVLATAPDVVITPDPTPERVVMESGTAISTTFSPSSAPASPADAI